MLYVPRKLHAQHTTGCDKKVAPKVFAVFSATIWDFNVKFYSFFSVKFFISNFQLKCDSVEKRRSYRI